MHKVIKCVGRSVSRVLSFKAIICLGLALPQGSRHPLKRAEQAIVSVGVASDRVYRVCAVPRRPVSSYLAFPPLPHRAVAPCGGISLLHCP